MTKDEFKIMEEYYSLKPVALAWYRRAMKEKELDSQLYCLLMWQCLVDESVEKWSKIGAKNQIRLTLIASGYHL